MSKVGQSMIAGLTEAVGYAKADSRHRATLDAIKAEIREAADEADGDAALVLRHGGKGHAGYAQIVGFAAACKLALAIIDRHMKENGSE